MTEDSSEAAFLDAVAQARREGRNEEVENILRRWIRAEPMNPAPRYGLAINLLQRGQWQEGWALWEERTAVPATRVRKPQLSFPEWRGEPISSLVVIPEQGLGDQIMFARYFPELVRRGIAVTAVVPPALARLFADIGVTPLTSQAAVQIPRADAWCLIGSLPALTAIPMPTAPYLRSAAGGDGMGVKTSGSPTHPRDQYRSMPPEIAKALLARGVDLDPSATGAADLEDTRRIIDGLRAVVTVDTSVAHLAGAMGKPTYVLLDLDPDWRWGLGETSDLYPSVRLVRQTASGGWAGVLSQLDALNP